MQWLWYTCNKGVIVPAKGMGLSPMSAYFEGPQVFFGGNAGKAVSSEVRESSHHPPTFARCWVCQFDGANLTRDCTNFPSGSRSSTALEPFLFDQKTHPPSLIHGALTCFPRIQWQRRLQAKGANLGTPSWAEVLNGLKSITSFFVLLFCSILRPNTPMQMGVPLGETNRMNRWFFFSSSLSHVMWTVRMTPWWLRQRLDFWGSTPCHSWPIPQIKACHGLLSGSSEERW